MSPPETIGRYEVVGRLAAGGMAEILLARVRGPAGFRRPVVVKRVFPHLADEPDFRVMFTDEARIVAELRHPNVVHVHELGLEAGELYLVMEYLAGESVSGLLRRLAERGERIDPALACHVVAEACAGLHAAHELRAADGEPRHVVHRDVSPQNVFVTYEGDVKVIDFGIAKAVGRAGRTRTGQVKGKTGYMSPEQCRQEEVDRTTDVFALGVVLHELVTGRRLFKGTNDVAVARAICDEPIPRAVDVWPETPPAVDAVIRRALEREPMDRYESAAQMRGALITVARELAPHLERRDALRALMRRLFGPEMEAKEADVSRTGALPAVAATPTDSPSTVADESGARRDWRPFAVALALFAAAAGAWGLAAGERAPAAPAAPTEAVLTLVTSPSGAQVVIDGVARGTTPTSLRLPSDSESIELELRLEGYQLVRRALAPDRDRTLELRLEPEARPDEPPVESEPAPRVEESVEPASAADPVAPPRERRRRAASKRAATMDPEFFYFD